MPVSSDIYSQIQQPQPLNRLAQLAQMQQVQLGDIKTAELARQVGRQNALSQVLASGGGADDLRKAGFLDESLKVDKASRENRQLDANIAKTTAETGNIDFEQGIKKAEHAAAVLSLAKDQGSYDTVLKVLGSTYGPKSVAQMPAVFDPAYVQAEIAKGMTRTQQLADLRQQQGQAITLRGQDLTAETARRGQDISSATSRQNNAATIKKDLQIAGMTPEGGIDANTERTAQAIAAGQLPAPTGMALLNPKNQRILGRVMEINPQYDSTTVEAKKKAARDFTSGPLGNSMRSFAVAGQHLDQLNELVDAMSNGNLQLVNKLGNAIASQTGSPAPTNFDAAKDVVSKEVVKAIVAGGGGVSERQELAHLMDNAKSPAQLKGVIQQYRNLMAAQHDALLTQRRAAGLPDSTLPKYADENGSPNAAAALPPDIAAILQKHGGK